VNHTGDTVGKKLKVLIVDDYEDTRIILKSSLESEGYHVTCVENGVEALASARIDKPDIIVSDILMPKMDGFDLCRKVKTDDVLRQIPFIFYTATYMDEADQDLAMAAGASRYLIKPMDSEDFLRSVNAVVEESENHQLDVPTQPQKDSGELELLHERAINRKLNEKVWELERERFALKQSQAKLRKFSSCVEQSGEAMLITDKHARIEYVNPSFTAMTGYTSQEVLGKKPIFFYNHMQDTIFYRNIWKTLLKGNPWQGKVVNKHKDGGLYPSFVTISPIHDQSDSPEKFTHFVAIQSDLTKIEDVEAKFQQAQKMEAIGTLVGGIAHDFNNILAGMSGNLYLARNKVQALPEVVQHIDTIESLSSRAAEMISRLLAFARKSMVNMEIVSLTAFLGESMKLLSVSVPENINLELNVCSEDLQVMGDKSQLHQVLMNLIINGVDALENVDAPLISITLEPFEADETFVQQRKWFIHGRHFAHVSISDNGCGVPASKLNHLFEPFFTTKPEGKGTGLGLAMVYGAVKGHDGFIEIESEIGQGATFHVYLPILERKTVSAADMLNKTEAVEGHGECILLVDDEEFLLDAIRDALEELGYNVLTAANGQEAVETFKAYNGSIDLVLLDVVMPIMGGVAAAKCMREIQPDIKLLFSSGYNKEQSLDKGLDAEVEDILAKPMSIPDISLAIRHKLDS